MESYEAAAKEGHVDAKTELGLMYKERMDSIIPEKISNKRAVKLFKEAAEKGNAKAQAHLAEMYLNNEVKGVKIEDARKAAKALLRNAVKQNEPMAISLFKDYFPNEK